MERTVPSVLSNHYRKSHAANANTSSFAAKVATTTEPTGDGVIALVKNPLGSGGPVPKWLHLVPYGLGSDDDVFDVKVWGWRQVAGLWVPTPLLKFTATISTAVGAAGAAVLATERFADTVAAGSIGVANVTYMLCSPADNTPASVFVDPMGCPKVEVQFDQTTGTPTMNCLVAEL